MVCWAENLTGLTTPTNKQTDLSFHNWWNIRMAQTAAHLRTIMHSLFTKWHRSVHRNLSWCIPWDTLTVSKLVGVLALSTTGDDYIRAEDKLTNNTVMSNNEFNHVQVTSLPCHIKFTDAGIHMQHPLTYLHTSKHTHFHADWCRLHLVLLAVILVI